MLVVLLQERSCGTFYLGILAFGIWYLCRSGNSEPSDNSVCHFEGPLNSLSKEKNMSTFSGFMKVFLSVLD